MQVTTVKTLVAGETDPFTIPLFEDDAALDGTGLTVTDVLITGSDGSRVDTSSKFAWAVQADGTVQYSPAATDFDAGKSPYRIRVQLTDGNSKTRFYPNTGRAEIVVLAPRG